MKRGFTIVELIVVVAVIAILLAITVVSYDAHQKRSYDAQTRTLAAALRSAAESYYNRNNEYPLSATLYGGTPNGTVLPSSYDTASTLLNIPRSTLSSDGAQLMPCYYSTCSIGTSKTMVHFITKTDAATTSAQTFTNADGCTYTLNSPESGGLAYLLAFYSYKDSKWLWARSNNGNVSTSCSFTAL